jgi:adenylylsulfate kinase-like enzyme
MSKKILYNIYYIIMIYWFTGQPGSGKTTLAKKVLKLVSNPIHIDGDNLRSILNNFDYSETGRRKNIENVISIARFLDSKGFTVVISVVAPYRDLRESLKSTNKVVEFYVHTLELRGREKYFCESYEKPEKNFINIDTTGKTVEETMSLIYKNLS